jgi:chemotaxis protein CheD
MASAASNPIRTATDGKVVIGVADLAVVSAAPPAPPGPELITHALGSCIGVTVYDPVARVGGMLHFMLPSAADSQRAEQNPAMFGDSGIPLLFRTCYSLGAAKERLVVCAAGGAEILNDDNTFRVGARNRTLLRKIFWKNSVLIHAEDTGGNNCRTMSLRMDTGTVEIRSQGKVKRLWPE